MLDIEFYRSYYNELNVLSEEEVVNHWDKTGTFEGRYPNQFVALEKLMSNSRIPDDFNIDSYLEINPDVADSIRWKFQGILHYLNYGIAEGRSYLQNKSSGTDYVALAPEKHQDEIVEDPEEVDETAALVPEHFNLVSYLNSNPDIRQSFGEPLDAIRHLIESGLSEERAFTPLRYDARFILQFYGVKIPSNVGVDEAVIYLKKKIRVTCYDLVFFSEEEVCRYYSVNIPYFPEGFDHDFYRYNYLRENPRSVTRAACVEHFCRIGQLAGHDISADLAFDEAFYRAEYSDEISTAKDDPVDLYRDWIGSTSDNPKWPNLNTLVKYRYHVRLPNAVKDYVALAVCAARHSEEPLRPSVVIDNLFEGNLVHPDLLKGAGSGFDYFYTAVADRLSLSHRFKEADKVYFFVIRHFPKYSRALNHRADQAQRLGDIGLAIDLRIRIIEVGASNEWTFLNLAQCLLEIGDIAHAVSILKKGTQKFPSDVGLKVRLWDYRQKYFAETWQKAPENALRYNYGNAQTLIERSLAVFDVVKGDVDIRGSVTNVAIYANRDLKQCEFYRVNQRAEQLKCVGYKVEIYNYAIETKEFIDSLLHADFVIVYRVPAFPYVIQALEKARALGLVLLYDIDDLIFDARHFPPSLESYAGHIDAEQHASMACGVTLFAHAMTLCDYGMASTRPLLDHVRDRVERKVAFHLPNSLSSAHYESLLAKVEKCSGFVTIFYGSGTKAHKEDFQAIVEPALVKIFEVFGNSVRVVLMGDIILSPLLKPWTDYVLVRGPSDDVLNYWDVLKECDINISVLSCDTFNDAKSEIKWMEAAMFGIPSVVSATQTYRDVVRNGETGILCTTSDDFYSALRDLIASEDLRLRIGRAARQEVLEKYSLQEQSSQLKSIIESTARPMAVERKKLVIVNVFYPPQAIGGATRVVHDNVKSLKAILGEDWQIDVVCTLEGGLTPYELDWYVHEGVRVFCITAANHPSIDSFVEDKAMGRVFERVIESIDPDIVHFHCIQRLTVSCVDIVIANKIPFVVTMHDGWWISPHQFLINDAQEVETYDFTGHLPPEKFLHEANDRARILRRCLSRASRILTVSKPFGEICRKVGVKNIEVIENGVSPLPQITRTRSASGRVRLGFIGGAAAHKGYNLIRNVVINERFSHLSLLVVDHAMHPNDIIRELWGNTPVEIRGKQPQSQVGDLYANLDVLLAPSVWPESYGLVTREAAFFGCWIVASDRGAVSDGVVEGKNGYVVNVDDERGLFDVLTYIDTHHEKHLVPPDVEVDIRTAHQQAVDLSRIYAEIVDAR